MGQEGIVMYRTSFNRLNRLQQRMHQRVITFHVTGIAIALGMIVTGIVMS